MTTKIFYFSGTGNTLKLAKDLSEALGGAELVRVTYDMDFNQHDCDVVGIAYPVYCFGIPNIVSHFIKQVKLADNAYIFGLASYGGLLAYSGNILQKKLKERGYRLSAGFAVNMPGNATYVYDVPKPEKREKMYQKQQERIKEIAAVINKRKLYGVDTNYGLAGRLMSAMCNMMMSKMHESDKTFVVEEKCDGCGVCANVCLVGNITMENSKPVWQHTCEGCLACFHWCPQAVIQAGKKTALRGRYHHPDVTLKDIIAGNR